MPRYCLPPPSPSRCFDPQPTAGDRPGNPAVQQQSPPHSPAGRSRRGVRARRAVRGLPDLGPQQHVAPRPQPGLPVRALPDRRLYGGQRVGPAALVDPVLPLRDHGRAHACLRSRLPDRRGRRRQRCGRRPVHHHHGPAAYRQPVGCEGHPDAVRRRGPHRGPGRELAGPALPRPRAGLHVPRRPAKLGRRPHHGELRSEHILGRHEARGRGPAGAHAPPRTARVVPARSGHTSRPARGSVRRCGTAGAVRP